MDGEDASSSLPPAGYGPGNWLHNSQQKLLHLWDVPGSGRLIRLHEAVSAKALSSSLWLQWL